VSASREGGLRGATAAVLTGAFGCLGLATVALVVVVVLLGGLTLHGCDFTIGPGTGTRSLRLPIAVSPTTGLRDGTEVRVTSRSFAADTIVGVAVCLREADTRSKGVAACDKISGSRYATDHSGRLDATFAVPRVITVAGRAHDCAAATERCILVAADASDFNRSGDRPISFRADLPAAVLTPQLVRAGSNHLPVIGTPAGPVAPNTLIRVTARGFQPAEPLLVARCVGSPGPTPEETCQPLNAGSAIRALVFHTVGDLPLHARADGTFTVEVAAAPVVQPYAGAGPTDCASLPGRCTIVITSAADTQRSAVLPYSLRSR
jgi:hypothetical protein